MIDQTGVSYAVAGEDQSWGIRATRDGVVSVTCSTNWSSGDFSGLSTTGKSPTEPGADVDEGRLTTAWRLAIGALQELGCRGPASLALRFNPDLPVLRGLDSALATSDGLVQADATVRELVIERAVDVTLPNAQEVAACHRELRRACNYVELEPDVELLAVRPARGAGRSPFPA